MPADLVECYRGLFAELAQEALELQPLRPGEFDQRSAAAHEAAHCVVAAREGFALRSARIFRGPGAWLGEFWIDWPTATMSIDLFGPGLLTQLRIILAGRRGELLFRGDAFSLRAGLDELAYALMMIVPWLAKQSGYAETWNDELYSRAWETTLAEVDETLLGQRQAVETIADRLIRQGSLQGPELAALLTAVAARTAPPPIRAEPPGVAFDPLAYPASDPRRALVVFGPGR